MELIKRAAALLCALFAMTGCGNGGVKFETVLNNEYAAYAPAGGMGDYDSVFMVRDVKSGIIDSAHAGVTDKVTAVRPDGTVNEIDLGGEKTVMIQQGWVCEKGTQNFWFMNGADEQPELTPASLYTESGGRFYAFTADSGQTKRIYAATGEKIYEAPSNANESLIGYAKYSGRTLVECHDDNTRQLRTLDGKTLKKFEGAAEFGLDRDCNEYLAVYPDTSSMTSDSAEYYDMDGKSISADSLALDDTSDGYVLTIKGGGLEPQVLANKQTGETVAQLHGYSSVFFRGRVCIGTVRDEQGFIEVYDAATGELLGSKNLGEYRVCALYKSACGIFAITGYDSADHCYGLIKIS